MFKIFKSSKKVHYFFFMRIVHMAFEYIACMFITNYDFFNTVMFLHTGVPEYVTTEISTSKQKKFNLTMFVDTPGLVDGDMLYPFDVNQSIEFLGKI